MNEYEIIIYIDRAKVDWQTDEFWTDGSSPSEFLNVIDQIYDSIDKKEYCLGVFLDLKIWIDLKQRVAWTYFILILFLI